MLEGCPEYSGDTKDEQAIIFAPDHISQVSNKMSAR